VGGSTGLHQPFHSMRCATRPCAMAVGFVTCSFTTCEMPGATPHQYHGDNAGTPAPSLVPPFPGAVTMQRGSGKGGNLLDSQRTPRLGQHLDSVFNIDLWGGQGCQAVHALRVVPTPIAVVLHTCTCTDAHTATVHEHLHICTCVLLSVVGVQLSMVRTYTHTHAHTHTCKAVGAPAVLGHPFPIPVPTAMGKRCGIWRRATTRIAMVTRRRGLISPRIQPSSGLTSEPAVSRLWGRAGQAAGPRCGSTSRKSWLSKEAWRNRRGNGAGRVARSGDSAFTSFHSTHRVVSTATAGRAQCLHLPS